MPPLPEDCTLLPLASGKLLVSPQHAVFCHIPAEDVDTMRGVVDRGRPLSSLGQDLREALSRHGFFGPPREPEPDPPSVQIQLTNACNLGCEYCCTNSGEPRQQEITLEQARTVVREARQVLGDEVRIALLGGEPLLVPWALDLAEEILEQDLDLTLFTNGLLLQDEDMARRVARLTRKGAEVRVSLVGASATQCDEISGQPRFEEVLANIQNIGGVHGGEVVVDLMLLPQHVEQVARDFGQLKARLPAGTTVALGLIYHSGRETGKHLFPSRSTLEAALDRIAFEAGEAISAPRREPMTHRREGCGCAMGRHLHLRSDGSLFTCFKMEEKVGALTSGQSFASQARQVRQAPHPAAALTTCRECPLATLCGGGCRSENYLYTGDPDQALCGPWRVQVISELLAEDRVTAVDWPVPHLLVEARARGIPCPDRIEEERLSRHLTDTA